MVVGIVLGTILGASALAFLIGRAVQAEVPIPPAEPPIIDDIPPDEIEEIDIIIPGGAEVLITQIGF